MSIVNFQTGEIVEGETLEPDLTATEARRLTDEIRETLRVGHGLIVKAFKGRAWVALGYPTWDSYCAGEFAEARMVRLDREQRREIVAQMKREGMSNMAIASGLGVAHSTVDLDSAALRNHPDIGEFPDRVVGIDGKDRPARPAHSVAAENTGRPVAPASAGTTERAHQEAELINSFGSIVRRSLTPKNVATLTPNARERLIHILETALNTLKETPA